MTLIFYDFLYLYPWKQHSIAMKTPTLLWCILIGSMVHLSAQTTISLTFTAEDNGTWLLLDSIRIENLTRGGDTTLYGTDTVLVLDHGIGIHDLAAGHGQQMILFPAYPNPVTHTSTVRLWHPQDGTITPLFADNPRYMLFKYTRPMGDRDRSFTYTPVRETFSLPAYRPSEQFQMQKQFSLSPADGMSRLPYTGYLPAPSAMRMGHSSFIRMPGDDLRFVGFASSGADTLFDSPIPSGLYTFQFGADPAYRPGTLHCNPPHPTAVVKVTNPATGKIWMDRNLGASQVATSSTDSLAYGDLYQWGRFADGHQCRTSAATAALSSSDVPGHGYFILAPDSPNDWRSPQNTTLWQGMKGVNNPCPAGYRVPTVAELDAERLSWSINTAAGAIASPLKLPLAGSRNKSDGSLSYVGSWGFYWSSSVYGTNSMLLHFSSTTANTLSSSRAFGLSVRCIKD